MSFHIKLFFTFVVFGIFLALFTVYSFSKVALDRQEQNKVVTTQELIKLKEAQISHFLKHIDNNIYSISRNKFFQDYLRNGVNQKYVEELLTTVTQTTPSVSQVRYIDKHGEEKINLQFHKNDLFYNSKNEKKQKNSDYFDQINSQQVGTIWHSNLGVNVDNKNNHIIPIVISGINLGYGILEVKVSLEKLIKFLDDKYNRFLLVDKKGDILIDSKKSQTENFLKNRHVDLKTILDIPNLHFLNQQYTNGEKFISMQISALNNEKSVLILLHEDIDSSTNEDMYYVYIPILLSTILLAIVLAYFFSKPMARMTNTLKKANKNLDQKVAKKTEQMQDMVKLIDKYVIRSVTDTRGVITEVSEAFCHISQYTKEELLGKPHSFVRHPDMQSSIFKELWETIQSGRSWEGKIKNLAKDGTLYWVEAHIEPNFENGKIVSYTAIRNDISDKVKLEELNANLNQKIQQEVKKSTEQLERIQQEQLKNTKLSSIGALAAGITHEINTPLTYIKGNFEMMIYDLEELPQSEIRDRILEDTEVITDGINRIGNIVESMREVSQTSSEIPEVTNIYSTLITALVLSSNRAKQIAPIYLNKKLFNLDMDKNELKLMAKVQRQRIEQVWIIIISNALDELVKINNYDDRKISINARAQGDKIVVDFCDNAGGIDEKVLPNIFDPFVSSKTSGGIGIGLNIARQIVEANNGTIEAKNIQNGAVFSIELDLVK